MTLTTTPRFVLVALAAALFLSSDHGHALQSGGRRASMDAALRGGVGLDKRPRVIVRYRDGAVSRLRRHFDTHGDRIAREHEPGQALAVEVHRDDIQALAANPDVLGLSLDSRIYAEAEKKTAGTFAAEVQPLRAWLGVPATALGDGVGIAIIDSGVAATLDVVPSASYDFTGSRVKAVSPSDPYGHGTHIAGLIAGNGLTSLVRYVGVAPRARVISLRVLDAKGGGLHERRHRGGRFRDREPQEARHRRHQPVAGPPDPRAGCDRPAGPGGRARNGRRHRRGGLGRESSAGPRRRAKSATPASRRRATRRRR